MTSNKPVRAYRYQPLQAITAIPLPEIQYEIPEGTAMLVIDSNGGTSPKVLCAIGGTHLLRAKLTLGDMTHRVKEVDPNLLVIQQLRKTHYLETELPEIQIQGYYPAGTYVKALAPFIGNAGETVARGTYLQCIRGGERPKFRYLHHLSYEVTELEGQHEEYIRHLKPIPRQELPDPDRYVALQEICLVEPDIPEEGYIVELLPKGGSVGTRVVKRLGMASEVSSPKYNDGLEALVVGTVPKSTLIKQILKELRNGKSKVLTETTDNLSGYDLVAKYADYRLSWMSPVMTFLEYLEAQQRKQEIRAGRQASSLLASWVQPSLQQVSGDL